MVRFLRIRLRSNIVSTHIQPDSITADKIQDGTIEGYHVATGSMVLDSLTAFSLSVDKGGTGSDSYGDYGVCLQVIQLLIMTLI